MSKPWSERARRGAPLLAIAFCLSVVGCGASAKRDFDLNKGETDGDQPSEASAAFDDFWVNPEAETEAYQYFVNEGDQLEVVLFTHPEQSRFTRVRPDGKISMPYVGDLQAAGRTPTEIAGELQTKYSEVLVNPRVDVLVQDLGGRFYVLGQVRVPGEFEYERPITLMQAIAKAQGYTDEARLTNLVLLRRDASTGKGFAAILNFRDMMQSDSKLGDIRIKPFDIVWVPRDNISRWDDFTRKTFDGIVQAEEAVIRGWSLINFEDVFERGVRP